MNFIWPLFKSIGICIYSTDSSSSNKEVLWRSHDSHRNAVAHRRRRMVCILLFSLASCLIPICTGFPCRTRSVLSLWCDSSLLHCKKSLQETIATQGETDRIHNLDTYDVRKNGAIAVWHHLLQRFQGDFDNYNQVLEERAQDLFPGRGGGHEHFHCTLIPVSKTGRLAAFYLEGDPFRIFRFRYYEIVWCSNEDSQGEQVKMQLSMLHPQLETLLRSHAEERNKWPSLFSEFVASTTKHPKLKYLQHCEVAWSLAPDPVQHAYILQENSDYENEEEELDGIHGAMVHGEAIVSSTMRPGMKIRVMSALSLFDNVFFIHDRGLDPETGAFLYGNQAGIPYRLERVVGWHNADDKSGTEPDFVRDDLLWTMGTEYRTKDEYNDKMEAIGGATPPRN